MFVRHPRVAIAEGLAPRAGAISNVPIRRLALSHISLRFIRDLYLSLLDPRCSANVSPRRAFEPTPPSDTRRCARSRPVQLAGRCRSRRRSASLLGFQPSFLISDSRLLRGSRLPRSSCGPRSRRTQAVRSRKQSSGRLGCLVLNSTGLAHHYSES